MQITRSSIKTMTGPTEWFTVALSALVQACIS